MPRIATSRPTELPAVIRPRRFTLAEIEDHLRRDDALGAMLRRHPVTLHAIARAVHARDERAYARFGSPAALLAHLERLL